MKNLIGCMALALIIVGIIAALTSTAIACAASLGFTAGVVLTNHLHERRMKAVLDRLTEAVHA